MLTLTADFQDAPHGCENGGAQFIPTPIEGVAAGGGMGMQGDPVAIGGHQHTAGVHYGNRYRQ